MGLLGRLFRKYVLPDEPLKRPDNSALLARAHKAWRALVDGGVTPTHWVSAAGFRVVLFEEIATGEVRMPRIDEPSAAKPADFMFLGLPGYIVSSMSEGNAHLWGDAEHEGKKATVGVNVAYAPPEYYG